MKAKDLLPPADPLGEALHPLRMSGALYCRSEFSAPWALALPAFDDCLMFHVVTAGACWLEVGATRRLLRRGEFALVPRGSGHTLASAPGVPARGLFELPREQLSERYEQLRHGGGGEATHAICGVVRFEHPAARRLVDVLPELICLAADDGPQARWLQASLQLMAAEAAALQPGSETVVTRLCDILLVQAIRAWIAQSPGAGGWLGALGDRQVGRALALIHRDPARAWTLDALAAEAAMSRSALARRFTALVGEPAMQYLTRWRMQLAQTWLEESRSTVGEVAARLGYESEAAFSRAFKRVVGRPPGASRRRRDQRSPASSG